MPKTFDQAFAERGLDVKHELHLARRRARYAQKQDRAKTFADANATALYCGYWTRGQAYTPKHAEQDLATLRTTDNTQAYIEAWCRLNNLTI